MSAASTTASPSSQAQLPASAKRFRANLQTYTIILALVVIWIFFYS